MKPSLTCFALDRKGFGSWWGLTQFIDITTLVMQVAILGTGWSRRGVADHLQEGPAGVR